MTLVPEIRDQIHTAARRRARSHGPARRVARPRRPIGGSLLIAASVLVVAGVLAVILNDAHRVTNGTGQAGGAPATAPPPDWGTLNSKALARAQQQDAACRPHLLTGVSAFRDDAPGRDLTSVLGVLRRPAPARQVVSARALRHLAASHPALDQVARGIYLRYVRPGQRNDITYDFIPAANINQVRSVPERCYAQQLTLFRQLADQRPVRDRGPLIQYETAWLQDEQTVAEHPAGRCLATAGPAGSATGPCISAVSLRDLSGRIGGGSDGNDHATMTALIVPDRVATVTAHDRPQTYPGRVPRPLTITQPAVQNLVIFSLQGAWDPPSSLTYRSATGAVLWSITRP